jgi:Bacteriophage holin family, superfamily II-like
MSGELEASMVAASSKTTTAGGVLSVGGFVLSSEWIGWIGLGIAIAGFLMQGFFSMRRDRRERQETALRMKIMQETHAGIKP